MYPLQSTSYLMHAVHWLSRAVIWRRATANGPLYRDHAIQLSEWAKADLSKWRLATFGA